jgi:putative membrane protein
MFISRSFNFKIIWQFAWRLILVEALLASAVYVMFCPLNWHFVGIPFLPVATVGTAVAFYVGFKNNSAYDRLWEGRILWGSITNTSRSFTGLVLSILGNNATSKSLIYRHLAWLHVLRISLRAPSFYEHPKRQKRAQFTLLNGIQVEHPTAPPEHPHHSVPHEIDQVLARFAPDFEKRGGNLAFSLMHAQLQTLIELKRDKVIDDFEHSDLSRQVADLLNFQGGCERLKTFPFPRQYGNFSSWFVIIFAALLPFGLIGEFSKLGEWWAWLVIPFSVLISWMFYAMELVGDASENPFEHSINDVPLTAICRTIEIDLRAALGEDHLPKPIEPHYGVLM